MTLVELAAGALTVAGALAGVAGLASTRRLRVALPMTLDLWTAAGLLRLSADRAWSAIALAAGLVAIRRLVARTLTSPTRAG